MNFVKKIKLKFGAFFYVKLRSLPFFYKIYKAVGPQKQINIIGLVRERNESLILQDTLDHLSQFVDGIVVFDDSSTDNSVEIAKNHPSVLMTIVKKRWQTKHREWAETADRNMLLKYGRKYSPAWFFYADADERFEGNIKEYLNSAPQDVDGIRISLFDAYITKDDKKAYEKGQKLLNFRKMFGVEQRDILMIWRNVSGIVYNRPDLREPVGVNAKRIITKFYCQHYGKSLSIEHWEETCAYYVRHFPKYREKWKARMGKAIHTESDFGTKLYDWEIVKNQRGDTSVVFQAPVYNKLICLNQKSG